MTSTIGLISPGDMGAAVGAAIAAPEAKVVWASRGRSDASRERAAEAGLHDVGDVAELAAVSDILLSVCPPHAAREVAEEVATLAFRGCYVDANAVAPRTARSIAATVMRHGGAYVDGSIIGPPPRMPGTTRLYLAGRGASQVAALFAGGALEVGVLKGDVPAASAMKMAYAGWTKGSSALLLTVRALAAAEGVEDDLVAEWARSLPDLVGRSEAAAANGATKGWRWIGEMDEIGASLSAVGMPDGFHVAAAEVYRRMEQLRHTGGSTDVQRAVAELLEPNKPNGA